MLSVAFSNFYASVIMLNVVMVSVIMLNVDMRRVESVSEYR
jgi:hypothetical protein